MPTISESNPQHSDGSDAPKHEDPDHSHKNEGGCNNCTELKLSITVLQDSIVSLKEEMLEQRAISDLVLSSPSTSDKKLSSMLKSKIGPVEDKLNALRTDLNRLRAAVDEQNKALELLMNMKEQILDDLKEKHAVSQTEAAKTNSCSKKRIEVLEITQENLSKALKNFAKTSKSQSQNAIDNLNHRIETSLQTIETTTNSNFMRIQKLETYQEGLPLAQEGATQSSRKRKRNGSETSLTDPTQTASKPSTERKPPSDAQDVTSRPTQSAQSYAGAVQRAGNRPFTVANKSNGRNHRESNFTGSTNDETRATVNSGTRDTDRSHQPESAQQDSNRSQTTARNNNSRYRRHTVLLLHDDSFNEFNSERFNRQFHVHCFKASSYASLMKQTKKLNNTIKQLKPDCIYIHTGINDFLEKKSGLVSHVKELAKHLLDTTKAQICFSALIPISENTSLGDRIRLVNDETRNYISWLHKHKPDTKERIFTFNNDKIGDFHSHSHTAGLKLSDRGQLKLWIRLREGLRKTLRLPRTSYHSNNRSRRSTNRFSDD